MSYLEAFGLDFNLGFELDNFPAKLYDRSYRNDFCPSFYFRVGQEFYILWVNFEKKEQREDPASKRYTLVKAINEGNDNYPEITTDHSINDLLNTNEISEIILFVKSLLVDIDVLLN